jgi:Na+(H+)/acetate symporter ActP
MPLLATIDPWILTFSAITVVLTIGMGFWTARRSKTASDFYVAGRSVSVGWNASAISGEYLSAASFMGVAGMVMSSGYDALWYPVCYACGYLFLLLFIAGPLRRFGAYTIPDFAEGRFDSPVFRKIAVCFVLFIGFFYTMPQMKGAGTTLAYIFPGLPYWAGVVLVGAVITLNVALGGMKGITLVQAFQYWAKMFAISVPIFVLMAVYGHYGRQLGVNIEHRTSNIEHRTGDTLGSEPFGVRGSEFKVQSSEYRKPLPEKAPADSTWLSPFGPLTTKAAKAAKPRISYAGKLEELPLDEQPVGQFRMATRMGLNLPLSVTTNSDRMPRWVSVYAAAVVNAERPLRRDHGDVFYSPTLAATRLTLGTSPTNASEIVRCLAELFATNGITVVRERGYVFKAFRASEATVTPVDPRPYSLLYTYSLIIALVCGTAGLPHILVRFYTNPDGVAAKRTTMWVMILIGIFYVFPPVFGVMGRNLLPELYSGIGAKGTDKIVLELPRLLNEKYAPLGSILSGITCAGAFAAFMSTFSGLLVSMTGAMAHDVYGRMLRPKSTPEQRMRMFKVCTVLIGGVAMLLGSFVEALEINFMVGQAFAIAAASYFPLLFMAAWWRNLTMKGAATGMLAGGLSAVVAISLTSFSTLATAPGSAGEMFAAFKPLNDFWAQFPLLRILAEQPAIWAVPLAIGLMIVVSKLTRKDVPSDIRMKMLVLHAPEKLGLKQEYIQEHQHGH